MVSKMNVRNNQNHGGGWDAVVAVVAVLSANYLAIFSMPQFDLSVRLVAYASSSIFWLVFLRSEPFAPVSRLLKHMWHGLSVLQQVLALAFCAVGIYIHPLTRIVLIGLLSYRGITMLLGEDDNVVPAVAKEEEAESPAEYSLPSVQLADSQPSSEPTTTSPVSVQTPIVEKRKVVSSSSSSVKPAPILSFYGAATSYRSPDSEPARPVVDSSNKTEAEVHVEQPTAPKSAPKVEKAKSPVPAQSAGSSVAGDETSESEVEDDTTSEMEEVLDIDYSNMRKKRRIPSSASSYISDSSSELDYSETNRKRRTFDSYSELILAHSSKRISFGNRSSNKLLMITASPANKENEIRNKGNALRTGLKSGRPILKRKMVDQPAWTAEEDATFHAYLKEEIEDRQNKRSKPSALQNEVFSSSSTKSVSFSTFTAPTPALTTSATTSESSITTAASVSTPAFTFGAIAATPAKESDSADSTKVPAAAVPDLTLKLPSTSSFTFGSASTPSIPATFGGSSSTDTAASKSAKDDGEKKVAVPSFTFGAAAPTTASDAPVFEVKSAVESAAASDKTTAVLPPVSVPAFTFGSTNTATTPAATADVTPAPAPAAAFSFSLPSPATGKPPTTPTSALHKPAEVPFGIAFATKEKSAEPAAPSTSSFTFGAPAAAPVVEEKKVEAPAPIGFGSAANSSIAVPAFTFGASAGIAAEKKVESAPVLGFGSTAPITSAPANPFASAFAAPAPASTAPAPVATPFGSTVATSAPLSLNTAANPFSSSFAAPTTTAQPATNTTSSFGGANPFGSAFPAASTPAAPATTTSTFGQFSAPASSTGSAFGASSALSTPAVSSSNPFAASFGTSTSSSNLAASAVAASTAPSMFGNSSASATPAFGQPTTSSTPNPFGSTASSATPFGAGSTGSNPFASSFSAAPSNGFSSSASAGPSSSGMFGSSAPVAPASSNSMFPSTTSSNPFAASSNFGTAASTPAGPFGSTPVGNPFGGSNSFGGAAPPAAAPSNPFGSSNMAPSNSFGNSSFAAPVADPFGGGNAASGFGNPFGGGGQPAFGMGSNNNNNNARRKVRTNTRK